MDEFESLLEGVENVEPIYSVTPMADGKVRVSIGVTFTVDVKDLFKLLLTGVVNFFTKRLDSLEII